MGLGCLEESIDGCGPSGVDLNDKIKYKKMHTDQFAEDDDAAALHYHHQKKHKIDAARKYVIAYAFFASLNTVLLGYDVGVMSGAIIFIHEDLKITEVQEEVLIGILSIVSLIGSLAGGRSSDAIGRKWTMALGAIIFQIGGIIMTAAPSFQFLMAGRLLSGIGIGYGTIAMGVYIAEISPSDSRGFLTSFPDILINLGILLGYVSNYAFSGFPVHINWRVMLALGILPSVIIGFALFLIPESPRWLVAQNCVEEARAVLLKTLGDEDEVKVRLAEIQLAAGIASAKKSEEKAVWYELLRPSPMVARMLAAGVGLQCFQQITGIDAVVYYSPTIFKEAGIQDKIKLLAATVAVGVTKTAFILVTLLLIDRVGRKPLLYMSTLGMSFCLFSLCIIIPFLGKGPIGIALSILAVCGVVAFFSLGMGPICWVITSEIYPLRLRAQAASLGYVGNRVFSGLVSLSFLSVANAITVAGTFFIFSVFSAISVAFVYYAVPETKGKTLEEIELLFKDRQPWNESEVELALGDTEQLLPKD